MSNNIKVIIESKCMDCCDYITQYPHWSATIFDDHINIQEHEINLRHKLNYNNYNIPRNNSFIKIKKLLEKSNKYARDTEYHYCSTNALHVIVQVYEKDNLIYTHKWYNETDKQFLLNQNDFLIEFENLFNKLI